MGQSPSKYNPQCTLDSCLDQLVGNVDNNGPDQFAACSVMFGTASTFTSTITLNAMGYTQTTTTVPYTDIIIETSTVTSTAQETSLSTVQVDETTTIYTATNVATSSVQATAPAINKKREGTQRRSCKPRASATTTPPPFAIASSCPSLEKYSSACSCIYAASDAISTTTIYVPSATNTNTITETSTIETSTSTSVGTSTITETTTQLSSITSTATVKTATETTTTITTTPPPPTQSPYLRTVPQNSLLAMDPSGNLRLARGSAPGTKFEIDTATGQVSPAGEPGTTLWLQRGDGIANVLVFYAPGNNPGGSLPVTWLSPAVNGAITLTAFNPALPAGQSFNSLWACASQSLLLARPEYASIGPRAGCTPVSSLRWSAD